MIKISREQVIKIAELAKMNVSGNEDKFAEMFTDTLNKIDVLNKINTDNVGETYQVTGLSNIFQDKDFPKMTLLKKDVLVNAKEVVEGMFSTKGVFEKE